MAKAVLGIIGGSGIYDLPGLENAREEAIVSPWGEPSAPVRRGTIAGVIEPRARRRRRAVRPKARLRLRARLRPRRSSQLGFGAFRIAMPRR